MGRADLVSTFQVGDVKGARVTGWSNWICNFSLMYMWSVRVAMGKRYNRETSGDSLPGQKYLRSP